MATSEPFYFFGVLPVIQLTQVTYDACTPLDAPAHRHGELLLTHALLPPPNQLETQPQIITASVPCKHLDNRI